MCISPPVNAGPFRARMPGHACIRSFFKYSRFKANHFLGSGMRFKAFAMFNATINGILREFVCLSCFVVGQIRAGFAAARRPTSLCRSRQNGTKRAGTGFRSVLCRLCFHLIAVDISFPRLRAKRPERRCHSGILFAICMFTPASVRNIALTASAEAATLTTMQSMCYGT